MPDVVLFWKEHAARIQVDGEELYVVDADMVLCVLEDAAVPEEVS